MKSNSRLTLSVLLGLLGNASAELAAILIPVARFRVVLIMHLVEGALVLGPAQGPVIAGAHLDTDALMENVAFDFRRGLQNDAAPADGAQHFALHRHPEAPAFQNAVSTSYPAMQDKGPGVDLTVL